MTEKQLEDPGDKPFFLIQNGWYPMSFDSEGSTSYTEASSYFSKKLTSGGAAMRVIIEITPGNRRQFYVGDPPEPFRKAAHDGDCLTSRGIADGEHRFRIHFSNKPESLADGINTIKTMLEEAA